MSIKECVNCPGATDHSTAECPTLRGLLARMVEAYENAGEIAPADLSRARALLDEQPQASAAQSVAVPDGWRLVPEEPTEEMWNAGCKWTSFKQQVLDIYRAMLAAPAQPAAQGYAIVPVDPTPKMLAAYMETDGAVKRWKAMVAAAKAEGVHV